MTRPQPRKRLPLMDNHMWRAARRHAGLCAVGQWRSAGSEEL